MRPLHVLNDVAVLELDRQAQIDLLVEDDPDRVTAPEDGRGDRTGERKGDVLAVAIILDIQRHHRHRRLGRNGGGGLGSRSIRLLAGQDLLQVDGNRLVGLGLDGRIGVLVGIDLDEHSPVFAAEMRVVAIGDRQHQFGGARVAAQIDRRNADRRIGADVAEVGPLLARHANNHRRTVAADRGARTDGAVDFDAAGVIIAADADIDIGA